MLNLLLVIDMQKDFVDGALGTPEAVKITGNVVDKVKSFDGEVIFTRDTHFEDYLNTQEGRNLPVAHCIKDTAGWQLIPELESFRLEHACKVFDKPSFGSVELAEYVGGLYRAGELESVTVIGLCTDICVVSNALMIKAFAPELPIYTDASCCAGVTPKKHAAALETMRSCQIGEK